MVQQHNKRQRLVKLDFTLPQVREKAKYKLWVKYKVSYTKAGQESVKCFYSYQIDGDHGNRIKITFKITYKAQDKDTKSHPVRQLNKKGTQKILLMTKINIDTKPYSLKELGNLYGVCPRTIKSWLKPFEPQLGKRIGRFYTKKQVEIIFNQLGHPEKEA